MKNCSEIAEEWGISVRTVTYMCKMGKIPGAVKDGKSWLIPVDAARPKDHRRREMRMSAYASHHRVFRSLNLQAGMNDRKKPLPIGISDYVRAQSDYYYVDKTLLIKEFLDRMPVVSLFTRPRRFGKTLNMDMLRVFFEINEEDTSIYFKNRDIWKMGYEYTVHQGKYPVIFLTFKDVKADTMADTLVKIRNLIQVEYGRHSELLNSRELDAYDQQLYQSILEGTASDVLYQSALEALSRMLDYHYGRAPVIIIDEYDTPIQEGYTKGFYEEIIGFMRNFFSGAFKDNRHLSFGFMTGILRIAQESLFSGLNNISVYSVMDDEYSQYFGFTQEEIDDMLEYYGLSEKKQQLHEWYDGYLFGNREIYNPWSVINYIAKGGVPQAYWVNTGKNEILEDVLKQVTDEIAERLRALLQGERVIARIDQNVVYRSLVEDPVNIYSFLLVAGYLKTVEKRIMSDGSYMCSVMIPNKEISAVYKAEILTHLLRIGAVTRTAANRIAESLYANDPEKLRNALKGYMDETISFYDAGSEGFYHGMVLGLIALMDTQYMIRSNREAGDGRYDIALIPRDSHSHGVIMELKWSKRLNNDQLQGLAEKALKQIDAHHYAEEMEKAGIRDILKLGIAFSGKNVRIAC